MPAKSKAQRQAAAIALHHPEQLHARNRGLAQMSATQLRHYASTSEKGLPRHTRAGGNPGAHGVGNRYKRLLGRR